jgi:hypothetical protein
MSPREPLKGEPSVPKVGWKTTIRRSRSKMFFNLVHFDRYIFSVHFGSDAMQ